MLTGCFCAVYLLFFTVQGSYLFGAFRHRLPVGFTVAQYARQGFFQLCMVMGVNFLLLWLVTHSSRALNRPGRIMCTVLLEQSILLAVTALSKLALYIACFGFTPLRLQSSWLVCVLLRRLRRVARLALDGAAHLPRVAAVFRRHARAALPRVSMALTFPGKNGILS